MNKEEYFKRIINRICKDYGYDVATAFEGLYLEKNKEIDRLNNIINETRRILGQYAHYSTPTEEQNAKNEAIVDEAYIKLHGNVAKGLKEEGNK